MKKTLMLMTVAALAAGVACAQNAGDDNSACPAGKKWDREGGHGAGGRHEQPAGWRWRGLVKHGDVR